MILDHIQDLLTKVNNTIIERGKEENDPRRLEADIEIQRQLDQITNLIQKSSTVDGQYGDVCENILVNGTRKEDRTGTGTLSVFGQGMTFDISYGKIPLLTTKKVATRAFIHELLWFLSGNTNIRYLKENNVNIWDSWVDPATEVYRPRPIDKIMKDLIDKDLGEFVLDELRVALVDDIFRLIFGDLQEAKDIGPRLDEFINNIDNRGDFSIASGVVAVIVQIAKDNGVGISELAGGDLPNVYGKQWRRWEHTTQILEKDLPKYEALGYEVVGKGGMVDGVHFDDVLFVHREIDQIKRIVDQLKNDPDSRRIILSPWNVGELEMMALPPCHAFFQLWTRKLSIEERIEVAKAKGRNIDFMGYLEGGDPSGENALNQLLTAWEIPERELSSQILLRSNDMPLGSPFNIGQYAVLTHMFAHVTNMTTGTLKWIGGDTHVYLDQIETLEGQLKNQPYTDSAWVMLNPKKKNIDDFVFDDFKIFDYQSHGPVKFPAAAI